MKMLLPFWFEKPSGVVSDQQLIAETLENKEKKIDEFK
jgi:hypothetical protein